MKDLEEKIDAFVRGEATDEEEQAIGEAMLESREFCEKVVLVSMLRRGLMSMRRSDSAVRRYLRQPRVLTAIVFIAALAMFFLGLVVSRWQSSDVGINTQAIVVQPSSALDLSPDIPVVRAASHGASVWLAVPCEKVQTIRVRRRTGMSIQVWQGPEITDQVLVTLPAGVAGELIAEVEFADGCDMAHFRFAVAE